MAAYRCRATVVNLVALQWVIQIPEYRKKQIWLSVIGIVLLGLRGLAESRALAGSLFLRTAVMIAFPLMPAPIRELITRSPYQCREDPATRMGTGAAIWIVFSMLALFVVISGLWVKGNR